MTSKLKVFIIAPKELYPYINDNLNKIINGDKVMPLLPFDFQYLNYIDGIILELAQKHLIKSYDYVMSFPDAELFSHEKIEYLRDIEAYNRGYQEWLKNKFEYSKKQIEEANLCLIFDNKNIEINDTVKKEINNEIKFASNKNKLIRAIYIGDQKDKKLNLYNDKMAS